MQYSNMTEHDLLVWIDWKANFTLPQGSVQTHDQYWAQSRMEVSCLGMVVYKGQHEGPPQKTGVVYISDIIDHTCLACCLQMEELKKLCGDLSKYRRIAFWFDTGPHYRTADLLSYIGAEWCEKQNRYDLICTINSFGEKHGKGQVDALFSSCNRWVSAKTKEKDVCLKSVHDLHAALQDGAARDMQQDPDGMQYEVKIWSSKQKPATLWKAETDLQIKKTYCVQVQLRGTSLRRFVTWENLRFSDMTSNGRGNFDLAMRKEKISQDNKEWRRGHYTSTRWMRTFPDRGDRVTLADKEEALKEFVPQDAAPVAATCFEQKVIRYQKRLADSRKKSKDNEITFGKDMTQMRLTVVKAVTPVTAVRATRTEKRCRATAPPTQKLVVDGF